MKFFEDELGNKIRNVSGTFVWHPPDGIGPWRPGDFIFGNPYAWGVIEAKQCPGVQLEGRNWTAQQRQFCERITRAGGKYYLVVNFLRMTKSNRGKVLQYIGPEALLIYKAFGDFNFVRDQGLPNVRPVFYDGDLKGLEEIVL